MHVLAACVRRRNDRPVSSFKSSIIIVVVFSFFYTASTAVTVYMDFLGIARFDDGVYESVLLAL